LALQKESEVVEGKLKMDHVHMVVSIPPKYSVSQVVGYVKGKSPIWVARATGRSRNFVGQNFWARGYCVSTIGLGEGRTGWIQKIWKLWGEELQKLQG
jgi:putative transposase